MGRGLSHSGAAVRALSFVRARPDASRVPLAERSQGLLHHAGGDPC